MCAGFLPKTLAKSAWLACLTFLFVWPTFSTAQYIPFLDQSQWYINTEGTLISAFDYYTTGKDTFHNGHTWQHTLQNSTTPTASYVREEIGTHKVYLTSAWDNWSERLLYDFDAQVNDTVALDFRFVGSQRFVVTSIDQVNTTAGFVPRINLSNIDGNHPPSVQWMQGIGDGDHPFYLDYTSRTDTNFHLICSYQNRQKVFDDGFGHCPGIPPPLSNAEAAASLPQMVWDGKALTVSVQGKGWHWQVSDLLGHATAGILRHGSNTISSLPSGLALVAVWRNGTVVKRKFFRNE